MSVLVELRRNGVTMLLVIILWLASSFCCVLPVFDGAVSFGMSVDPKTKFGF